MLQGKPDSARRIPMESLQDLPLVYARRGISLTFTDRAARIASALILRGRPFDMVHD